MLFLPSLALAVLRAAPKVTPADHFQLPITVDSFSPVVILAHNGRTYRFLIDSGSDESVVAGDLVPDVAVGGLADFALGPDTVRAKTVGRDEWSGLEADHIDGLLGVPELRNYAIGIDYSKAQAYFWRHDPTSEEICSWLGASGNAISRVPLSSTEDGLYDVSCTVEGNVFHSIVDTGSNLNQVPPQFHPPRSWSNLAKTRVSTNSEMEDVSIFMAPSIDVSGSGFQWKMFGIDPPDDPEADPNEGLIAPSSFWGPRFIFNFRKSEIEALSKASPNDDLRLVLSDVLRRPVKIEGQKVTLLTEPGPPEVEVVAIAGIRIKSLFDGLNQPQRSARTFAKLYAKSEQGCEVELLVNGLPEKSSIPIQDSF